MPLNISKILRKLTWTRDSSGNNWYVENNGNGFGSGENMTNLELSQNHLFKLLKEKLLVT